MPRRYNRYHDTRHSAGILRECSRCRRELTDAASREHGIGPVCRRKTNDLHARQIPANLNVASALFLSLRSGDFGDAMDSARFTTAKRRFVTRMRKLAEANDDLTAVTLVGADFRKVVDFLDFAMSFQIKRSVRVKCIEIVEALGYVGLGGVLRGDACMSPATLLVDGDSIKLSGKSCSAGFRALKANIPGVRCPRYRGSSDPYVASVRHAAKFVEIALRYWPFIDADSAEVLADAAKAVAKLPAEETAAAPVHGRRQPPAATVTLQQNGWFTVATPWVGTRGEMQTMLDRFRALPRSDRKYLPRTRSWSFKVEHHNKIIGIVGERYSIIVA